MHFYWLIKFLAKKKKKNLAGDYRRHVNPRRTQITGRHAHSHITAQLNEGIPRPLGVRTVQRPNRALDGSTAAAAAAAARSQLTLCTSAQLFPTFSTKNFLPKKKGQKFWPRNHFPRRHDLSPPHPHPPAPRGKLSYLDTLARLPGTLTSLPLSDM